jgi:hypothetical protein
MNRMVRFSAMLLVLIAALPAFSDDQDKTTKELAKVTAMTVDSTGRTVVNRAMADVSGAKRTDLVEQRQTLNVNYGSLFIVQELLKSGAKMDDIAAQFKAGKTITQVANDQHANWKQMAADAKKLNTKIDDVLYKHFLNPDADKLRDLEDKYDLSRDAVAADGGVPKADVQAAGERFVMWKERANEAGGHHHVMDTAEQQAAYSDHARAGGPTGNAGGTAGASGNGSVGSPAPAAGGARTGPN